MKRKKKNWSQIKGGLKSRIKLLKPKKDSKLAEFIGILLGDGNICSYKKGKKIAVYHVKIAGHLHDDKEYHLQYIKPLCEKLFNLKVKEMIYSKHNERFTVMYSKELIDFLGSMNLKPGNKIKNQTTIPK